MALTPVGYSFERGTMQYLNSDAAQAFFALRAEFVRVFPKSRPLEVTEGDRSRARQLDLWNQWEAYLRRGKKPPYAALAARPYTSNHNGGNAADFRSPVSFSGSDESKWMRANAPRFGWHPTGYDFASVEPWHYDYRHGTATAALTTTEITQEEDDMPLNDDDKNWIRDAIRNEVNANAGGYIVQSNTASVLVGAGFTRNLNAEEISQARGKYPILAVGDNQRAFDLHVDIHRPRDLRDIIALTAGATADDILTALADLPTDVVNEIKTRL